MVNRVTQSVTAEKGSVFSPLIQPTDWAFAVYNFFEKRNGDGQREPVIMSDRLINDQPPGHFIYRELGSYGLVLFMPGSASVQIHNFSFASYIADIEDSRAYEPGNTFTNEHGVMLVDDDGQIDGYEATKQKQIKRTIGNVPKLTQYMDIIQNPESSLFALKSIRSMFRNVVHNRYIDASERATEAEPFDSVWMRYHPRIIDAAEEICHKAELAINARQNRVESDII